MDVIYNEAFGSPNILNVYYIHPLSPKSFRVYMYILKTFEFFESNSPQIRFENPQIDSIRLYL